MKLLLCVDVWHTKNMIKKFKNKHIMQTFLWDSSSSFSITSKINIAVYYYERGALANKSFLIGEIPNIENKIKTFLLFVLICMQQTKVDQT